jgi:hypothetical protein
MYTEIRNYIAEDTGSFLKFYLPWRKSWFKIFLLLPSVVIGIYIIFFSPVWQAFIYDSVTLLLFLPFLAILLLFGGLTLTELLWQFRGLEIVEIAKNRVTIKHQIFGINISKNLRANKIDGVFVSKKGEEYWLVFNRDYEFLNFKKGALAINYGKTLWGSPRTYRFGSILNREDAKRIVQLIHERFPQYKYRGRTKGTYV